MKNSLLLKGISLLLLCTFFACGPMDPPPPEPKFPLTSQFDYQVYFEWNELFKKLDRVATGYRPCPAPRALAYLGLSAYESVVPGMPLHQSLAPHFPNLNLPDADQNVDYFWPACVNESYAYLLERFFPHLQASPNPEVAALFSQITVLRNALHNQFAEGDVPFGTLKRSEAFGREVATAVFTWSQADMIGHNAFLNPQPSSYIPPVGPGLWQPTYPDYRNALFPSFGGVGTFAMSNNELICQAPIPYSENAASNFYAQALEVYSTSENIQNPPLDLEPWALDQRWIAEFWSDDNYYVTFSPATRWISIANQMTEKENINLAVCAELYAKLGLALHDATISLWKSKYHYNVERPISYIHSVVSLQYPGASAMTTLLNDPIEGTEGITPPFPSYPSAHAGFAGGGSKILASFFENAPGYDGNYVFADGSHMFEINFLGTPRVFNSIKEMGEECAFSRFSMGVNFRMDCEAGLQVGRLAAQRVLELPWKK